MVGSMHQKQETDGAPSYKNVQSSVCGVCQGLFDKDSRRGYALEMPWSEPRVTLDDGKYYMYTYIHHADLRSLLVSVEGGCRICTIIAEAIRRWRIGDDEKINAAIQAQKDRGLLAGPQAAQPDVGVRAATELAEVGKRERFLDIKELYYRGKNRILIRSCFDFESQGSGRFYGDLRAYIYYLTDHNGESGQHNVYSYSSTLTHIYTLCMFMYSQKTSLQMSD